MIIYRTYKNIICIIWKSPDYIVRRDRKISIMIREIGRRANKDGKNSEN